MTRPSREPVLALLVGAVLAVVLSGCVMTTSRQLAGPGMMVRTGQGSVRCSDRAPVAGTRVDVILMDPGRRAMMSGAAVGRMPFHAGSMGASMRVRMMLVAAPHVVAAGQVTFVAVNRGARTHELVVLPLDPRAPVGRRPTGLDRAVDESTSLGEASGSCASGEGDGLVAGTTGWITLRLTPGRYELVCNRPGHYAKGMYAELVVR
jgi:uncharacterized cupredoxin-like copper-binding protein